MSGMEYEHSRNEGCRTGFATRSRDLPEIALRSSGMPDFAETLLGVYLGSECSEAPMEANEWRSWP